MCVALCRPTWILSLCCCPRRLHESPLSQHWRRQPVSQHHCSSCPAPMAAAALPRTPLPQRCTPFVSPRACFSLAVTTVSNTRHHDGQQAIEQQFQAGSRSYPANQRCQSGRQPPGHTAETRAAHSHWPMDGPAITQRTLEYTTLVTLHTTLRHTHISTQSDTDRTGAGSAAAATRNQFVQLLLVSAIAVVVAPVAAVV